jgi:ATP-binding cassette subfamily B (MDR/TAP) protein 1
VAKILSTGNFSHQCAFARLGLVSQEPTLFDGTIAENIKFGMKEATQAEIEEAAKKANAHNFIMDFPDRYDTLVGSASSSQISGGQKQRVAVSTLDRKAVTCYSAKLMDFVTRNRLRGRCCESQRCCCLTSKLMSSPSVLMCISNSNGMDPFGYRATSALDSESEKVVQAALDGIMADSKLITIVIAHRLSTIRGASKIAYIDHGKVREIGTYEELMAKPNGHYKRLEALQSLDQGTDRKEILNEKAAYKKLMAEEKGKDEKKEGGEEEKGKEVEIDPETAKLNEKKARDLAKSELPLFIFGSVGAVLAGLT